MLIVVRIKLKQCVKLVENKEALNIACDYLWREVKRLTPTAMIWEKITKKEPNIQKDFAGPYSAYRKKITLLEAINILETIGGKNV